MSVSFLVRKNGVTLGRSEEVAFEACLCSQLAPSWSGLSIDDCDLEELREHANPQCSYCKGTGVEKTHRIKQEFEVNWANANAQIVLHLLGFHCLWGETTPSELKWAILRARGQDSTPFVREAQTIEKLGRPVVHVGGQSSDQIESKLDQLAALVVIAEEHGADQITWG